MKFPQGLRPEGVPYVLYDTAETRNARGKYHHGGETQRHVE